MAKSPKAPKGVPKNKGREDDTYPDARDRGDAVLRRMLQTKPQPKWKPNKVRSKKYKSESQ
jgi:hypothetical protein